MKILATGDLNICHSKDSYFIRRDISCGKLLRFWFSKRFPGKNFSPFQLLSIPSKIGNFHPKKYIGDTWFTVIIVNIFFCKIITWKSRKINWTLKLHIDLRIKGVLFQLFLSITSVTQYWLRQQVDMFKVIYWFCNNRHVTIILMYFNETQKWHRNDTDTLIRLIAFPLW